MRPQLTCYAVGGKNGEWEAVCVDLDIAVQGRSFEEVYETLNEAIREYIERAKLEEPSQGAKLLSRAAPWYVRLRLEVGFLWNWFRGGRSDGGQAAGFTLAYPA